jgi:hypothetical protein
MTDSEQDVRDQLGIVALLDERFRLREDPEKHSDLEATHRELRERLRRFRENEASSDQSPDSIRRKAPDA